MFTLGTANGSHSMQLESKEAIEMELLLNLLQEGGVQYAFGRRHARLGDALYNQRTRYDLTVPEMQLLHQLRQRVRGGGETWRNTERVEARAWYEDLQDLPSDNSDRIARQSLEYKRAANRLLLDLARNGGDALQVRPNWRPKWRARFAGGIHDRATARRRASRWTGARTLPRRSSTA